MSVGAALLQIVLAVVCLAALFGAFTWWRFRAHGSAPFIPLWAATAVITGSVGAARSIAVQERLGLALQGSQRFALATVFVAFLAIVLAPPALALRHRALRRPESSVGRAALSAAGWSLLGLLIAAVIAVVLDLANVPLMPVPRRR